MNYVRNYQKIVNNFIKKSFPILKDEKISIKEKEVVYRAHANYFPWGMIIIFSRKLRKFPEKSIKRIIFHELCHLEIFKRWGPIKTSLTYLVYRLSKTVRKKVEAEANALMIKKRFKK